MPSAYLTARDYAAYGVPDTTTPAQVIQASTVVDQVLKRPEGLVWVPDATGLPTYMAAATPTMSYALAAAVVPGRDVVLTLNPAMATPDLVGDVLVLERGSNTRCEAVVVTAVTGRDTVTVDAVRYPHSAAACADLGLVITEERALPAKRQIARVSRLPCVRIVGCQGRYGYGRRSDQIAGGYDDLNLLSIVQAFGGPPAWVSVDPTQASVSPTTGDVWVPTGILIAAYSDVRLRYLAGYAAENLPPAIKMATASIIGALVSTADLPGQIKMYKAGDTAIQRFGASNIDPDTRAMLRPFEARSFF